MWGSSRGRVDVHGGVRELKTAVHYHGVEVPAEKIAGFCRRWQIKELSFFGSILRPDFKPDSDIDVLVAFAPEARWSVDDFLKMEEELKNLLGRSVDLVERGAIEKSENYIRRKHILRHVENIYVA
jgi:uncharacterized protein